MDNKTEYFFVLKPDGKIGWIEKMPEIPEGNIYRDTQWYAETGGYKHPDEWYKDRLQSAISNAIEVSNQEEVKVHIFRTNPGLQYILENTPYPLLCHVEKKEYCEDFAKDGSSPFDCPFYGSQRHKTVALVTFPSSAGVEETQEGMISVFVLDMHGSKVYDTLKSNLLGMIECEIENLDRGEFEELDINITRIQMTQAEYGRNDYC